MSRDIRDFGTGVIFSMVAIPLLLAVFGQIGVWASHVPELQENTKHINSNVIKLTKSTEALNKKLIENLTILTGRTALNEYRITKVEEDCEQTKGELIDCQKKHRDD